MPYRTVWSPDPLSISFRPGLRSGAASLVTAVAFTILTVLEQTWLEQPLMSLLQPDVLGRILSGGPNAILIVMIVVLGPPFLALAAIVAGEALGR